MTCSECFGHVTGRRPGRYYRSFGIWSGGRWTTRLQNPFLKTTVSKFLAEAKASEMKTILGWLGSQHTVV
jgi:hypothetical protein